MHIVLEITEGREIGKTFTADGMDVALVGRSPRCHFWIGPDPKAGRVHLILDVSPTGCSLRDLGSKNGTYVNDVKVGESELQDGDQIRLGKTTLYVHMDATAPTKEEQGGGETVWPDQHAEVGPDSIPGYRLQSAFKTGGMGTVWLAEDLSDGKTVVIKIIRPDRAVNHAMRQLFLRESKISLALRHPNIVEFIDAGDKNGVLYIVMEYVHGVDADALRRNRGGTLPWQDVVAIGCQVLSALEYAHAKNIVHRDMKPANILVSGAIAADYVVKVTDFGIARSFGEQGFGSFTQTNVTRGSVQFMPPEQVTNCKGVDHRADIFSLGATLYNLLTGKFVWPFSEQEDPFVIIVQKEVVPLRDRGVTVPDAIREAIDRSLNKDPAKRFQSAAEMRSALQSVS
jgi:serine/threonine-protein kinase